jgi:c-di-GMP-binding flagellar brake protein YcgR
MDTAEERRRFVRLNILADVIYKKVTPANREKLSLTKNISKGGICLIVYEELKEEDILELEIYLPEDKNPILAKGRIVWIKEFIVGDLSKGKRYDTGIEFIEANDEDLNKIDKYVFARL